MVMGFWNFSVKNAKETFSLEIAFTLKKQEHVITG
jgi:hypothetical protein